MKKNEETKLVWIGMLTVKPLPGNEDLNGAKLAVVNVLYYTNSQENYISEVKVKMTDFGYEVLDFEDVELFNYNSISDSLNNKAQFINESNRFDWDKFYIIAEDS